MGIHLTPLNGIDNKVSSDYTKVEVIGATALWVEKRFTKSIVVDQKMHDIEIWIAGPSQYLTNVTLEELVLFTTIESPTSIKIETEILKDKISLLSIQPNSIEHWNENIKGNLYHRRHWFSERARFAN